MSTSRFLATKLFVPAPGMRVIPRPRLAARLDAGRDRKLMLISAPAGWGKTTLVADWIRGARAGTPRLRCGWLSLDAGDNDLVRFLGYLIAALQVAAPGLGAESLELLASPSPPSAEELLTGLINEIGDAHAPITLVMDDFHILVEPQVLQAVRFLIEHMPPSLHVILSGRADPPWPLARLRARGEMAEFRSADLRFTAEETGAFLSERMGLALTAAETAALDERIEGWAAGLQMAALSLAGRADRAGFIADFTGSNRFICDYLIEEVLEQQPPDMREFLLKTSILPRLSADLCNAVMGDASGASMLERLECVNPFLIPLDDERRWYRYHHLFADLLRHTLQQAYPGAEVELHRRAGLWHERQGMISGAVEHALAAGDPQWAARLIEESGFALISLGQLTTLLSWLDTLPREIVRARPALNVLYAWTLMYMGRLAAVEDYLRQAEPLLPAPEAIVPGSAEEHLTGHVAAVRAFVADLSGQMGRAAELGQTALRRLSPRDLKTRGFLGAMLGTVLQWTGDLAGAGQALEEAVRLGRELHDRHMTVHALCDLAALQVERGELRSATATCREALREATRRDKEGGPRSPVAGYAYIRMSAVMRHHHDLAAALTYAQEGLELCRRREQADLLCVAHSNMSAVLQAMEDLAGAVASTRAAQQIVERRALHYVAVDDLANLYLTLQGDHAAGTRWLAEIGLPLDRPVPFITRSRYILAAQVLLVLDRLSEAQRLLENLLGLCEGCGSFGFVIRILILQALVFQAQGRQAQARQALARALDLAAPEGFVFVFVEHGPRMRPLLQHAAAQGHQRDFARGLLAALDAHGGGHAPASSGVHGLAEPLSSREIEVLRLLHAGLTNGEIAAALTVAPSTVHTHVKHIYAKLDVHRRFEAVRRAEELDLLDH